MTINQAKGPLCGLKVIEFAGLGPVPFCGMLLSDMGAEVIRIDHHNGQDYQHEDVESRGRKSIVINLKDPAGQAVALALIDKAEILIEGFRPGVMERRGLGPEQVLKTNPGLVYGRMTGWGQSGPLANKAGHDLNYLAITGALHAMGSNQKPTIPLNLIADFGGGALYLVMGILAALHQVKLTGVGEVIDCAMTEGVISMLGMIYGDFAVDRWQDQRETNIIDGGAHFYNVYQCADDKWLSLAAIESKFYIRFLHVAGLTDKAFLDQWNKSQWPKLKNQLASLFLTKTRQYWCELFADHDVCLTPVLSLKEAQQFPHNIERETFIKIDGITQPAPAPRFKNKPSQVQFGPIKKGQHSGQILIDWQVDNRLIEKANASGALQN